MKVGNLLKVVGTVLIVVAAALAYKNIDDERNAEMGVLQLDNLVQESISDAKALYADTSMEVVPDYVLNPEAEMPIVTLSGKDVIGQLNIPAIGLRFPIQSEWDVKAAKQSPCRYVGSCYTDDMIIAGHNYRTHFKPLTQLVAGDKVQFIDMDGNEFLYCVVSTETIDGYDIGTMKSGEWDLTLFTCTYGGKMRYTVRCNRLEVHDD